MSEKIMYTRTMHDKWMTAMKSGNFKYCKARLESIDGKSHCALGVFYKLNNITTHIKGKVEEDYTGITKFMPRDVYAPIYQINDQQYYLNNFNYPVVEISEILCEAFPHLKKKSNEKNTD